MLNQTSQVLSTDKISPLVSVVIATYNYSSVLRYALQSVLWQTFQDFEVWVIGDACTDDSETVTASFGDPPTHLELLINALERNSADVGNTLLMMLCPESPFRMLYGLWAKDVFEPLTYVPPSSIMHKRDMGCRYGNVKRSARRNR